MSETAIKFDHVSKEYRLGAIGGGTLRGDLQSWAARRHGKEDPNVPLWKKQYNGRERFLALDDVSFEVKKGEALGIIGANGAGKSTLLKLLSRVTAPTSGTISYNGRIASMLEVGTGFHPELTGRENVYMNGAILGMTKAEISKKFDQIVEFAEMGRFIDTPVKRYSSGMYVKLAFSVAAHLDSEILVMDEVLAVGDMKFQEKCLGRMGDAASGEGRTVLYVSHNMNTIRQLCTRCLVLDRGKIIFDGDVESAIGLYSNASRDEPLRMEFVDDGDGMPLSTGKKIRLLSAEYIGRDNISFAGDEPLRVRLCWENLRDADNINLRLEIWRPDRVPVATAIVYDIGSGREGERMERTFEADVSALVPGSYQMVYTFFGRNEFGTNSDYEWRFGLRFKRTSLPEDNIVWDAAHWGNVRLPDAKLL